jgi:two-component system, NarL family, nitrate/nitrite response regulator NarL
MEPGRLIRIVLADDHPIFRDGLRRLLEAERGFEVVGDARDGLEALDLVATLQPDILLLDVSMPTIDGLEVLKRLPAESSVRTIVLTAGLDDRGIVAALQYGARGVLLKGAATPLLYKSIRCVMQGEYWIGRDHVGDVVEALRGLSVGAPTAMRHKRPYGLTPRELEIVAGIVAGESNREIAERLSVREHTVKQHLSRIFDKTGVSSRLELAVFALNHGLTGPT